jgi:uncharacterized protein (DUF2147 family)
MFRLLITLLISCALYSAEEITGFWKTVNEETGKAQAIIAIYEHEGFRYGKIIGSLGDNGKMDDSIYHPVKTSPGLPDHPYYSGMDIIWYLEDRGYKFKGKILDPEHGDVYNSELWKEGENLIVRGKLLMFGRSQTWLPATSADFPKDFKKPDLKTLQPNIPTL